MNCRDCHKEQREERGCEKDSVIPGRWKIGDDFYQRCPIKLITEDTNEYLFAYQFYKEGFLPNGKGWANESMKFIQAMKIISSEVNKNE